MKYFSLFSGIGGFEYGIQNCRRFLQSTKAKNIRDLSDIKKRQDRVSCIGFSEINKYSKQIYKKHFKEHKDYGNCTRIDWKTVPDFDCLVGGFPCQAFSIAGKRKGFKDTRGTLFFEIARCLKEKQPRLCVLENVKGLLSHDKGATFFTIISKLDELGYDCQWQVLNSKNFGVPQNRERVFIIGHLRGTSRPKIFPIRGGHSNNLKEITQKVSDAQRIYDSKGLAKSQKALGGGLGAKTGLYAVTRTRSSNQDCKKSDTCPPLRQSDKAECRAVLTPDREEKRQNGRRLKEDGEPSFTLTAQDKHGIYDGIKIRRLTPTECERLQSFPDGWTKQGVDEKGNKLIISDSQRYKCLGNAVTVNVIKFIFGKMVYTGVKNDA